MPESAREDKHFCSPDHEGHDCELLLGNTVNHGVMVNHGGGRLASARMTTPHGSV